MYKIAYLIAIAFCLFCMISSCEKEDAAPAPNTPIIASLKKDTVQIVEGGSKDTIEIKLSKPSPQSGTLLLKKISGSAVHGLHYKSIPAVAEDSLLVPVTAGQTKAFVIVEPLDNNARDGHKKVIFQLISKIEKLYAGNHNKLVLQIKDNEEPVVAEFAENKASVPENIQEWINLRIQLSHPASDAVMLKVKYQGSDANLNQHVQTKPAVQSSEITITVPAGATEAVVKLKPVDDLVKNADRVFVFSLIALSDNLLIGAKSSFQLHLLDNETNITQIDDLRTMYKGSAVYFFGPKYIEGIITTVNDNTEEKMAYVQDNKGGIAIRFHTRNKFQRGDKIRINIENGVLNEDDGELVISNVFNDNAVKTGVGVIETLQVSLETLFYNFGDHEGKVVSVYPVTFTGANGVKTLLGEQMITDGQRTALVKTESYASFASMKIPNGKKRVQGILIRRGNQFIIKPQVVTQDIQ